MIDLNDYYYFVHVVEKKGFSPAARALNMPKSRLSRHISTLEERLETKLIHRTSRQFRVTEAGLIFFRHARSIIDEMEVAEAAIESRKTSLNGKVSISCSIGVAQFAVKELIVKFMTEHPKVNIIQQVTNDHADLVASGIDLSIRGHIDDLPDSSIVQRKLAAVSWHLYANPSYLSKTGIPQSPQDLTNKQGLQLGWQSTKNTWNLRNASKVKKVVPFNSVLCSDDMNTLKAVTINGLGIVSLPAYTCRDEITAGTLVRVLPDWLSGNAQLSLLMPSRKGQSLVVKAFSEFLLNNVSKIVEVD